MSSIIFRFHFGNSDIPDAMSRMESRPHHTPKKRGGRHNKCQPETKKLKTKVTREIKFVHYNQEMQGETRIAEMIVAVDSIERGTAMLI